MSFKAPSDALNTKKLSKYPHALNPFDISSSHQMFHSLSQNLSTKSSSLNKHVACWVCSQCCFLASLSNGSIGNNLQLRIQSDVFFSTRFSDANTFLSHSHTWLYFPKSDTLMFSDPADGESPSQDLLMIKGSTAADESLNWPHDCI